jgi:hypothetical protein
MIDEDAIRCRWETVGSKLDERGRRLFAAAEVQSAGYGGLAVVSKITGLARSTINRGEDDLGVGPLSGGRVRRKGGGRRAVSAADPGLVPALKSLVEPATLGSPVRPLIWVSKSMDKLARTLTGMGHPISADTVRKELVKLGFSRQANRKSDEGSRHPDRDAQFEHINAKRPVSHIYNARRQRLCRSPGSMHYASPVRLAVLAPRMARKSSSPLYVGTGCRPRLRTSSTTMLLSRSPSPARTQAASTSACTLSSGSCWPAAAASSSMRCTSLRVWRTRPSGAKSRATIFGPLVSMTWE